jgi:hypothetical protein
MPRLESHVVNPPTSSTSTEDQEESLKTQLHDVSAQLKAGLESLERMNSMSFLEPVIEPPCGQVTCVFY